MHKHAPHLVICCWMPFREDWTAAFRECPTVDAYLLLGECDDGASGDPWATWGYDVDGCELCSSPSGSVQSTSNASASPGESSATSGACTSEEDDRDAWRRIYERAPHRTPFGAAGWARQAVPLISSTQIGRTDAPWCNRRHSTAVAFFRCGNVLVEDELSYSVM